MKTLIAAAALIAGAIAFTPAAEALPGPAGLSVPSVVQQAGWARKSTVHFRSKGTIRFRR